jgi:TMEM175 potassium channel family protein
MRPTLPYNRIAGQSIERLAALSDGIFAVAMTLLVLEIHVPEIAGVHTERDLLGALAPLLPRLLVYLMSFLTLGIFWNGQQVQLTNFDHGDRNLTWIHIAFLATVSVTPFSTGLLQSFIHYRIALAIYWLNLLMLGVVLYASWRYATRAGLLREEFTYEMQCAVERRILVAQALYAVGFALCVFGTFWSIVAIVLLQLNYAIAPRIPWLKKI